jgi:hypothetical protein
MMNFHDDVQPFITQLDSAWELYTNDFEEQIQQVLTSIASWRWATEDMFPSHPLFGQADTTPVAEPWQPFTRNWLSDDDPKANVNDAWHHGFDEKGRIVLARNRFWGHATVWRKSDCDRLWICESREESGRFIWGLPNQDHVQFTRFWHNSDGRIECMCRYSRQNDTHFRHFEWFEFEGKRCVESIQQSFDIMPEIPHYQRGKSEAELREDYRPLEGNELIQNLVETMFMRRRVKYSYSPSGDFIKAEEFKADGEPMEELRFQKLPERPFEETIDDLAAKTAATIFKAAAKRLPTKPYRSLILMYSAEHAHCGLPHHVSVVGHVTPWPKDRFNDEDYPDELDVAFKRPVLNLLTEFNQRCYARFAMDDFEAGTAAAVTVMRKIAEQLYQDLAGTKHVTNDFAVLAIDDHGDVDGFAVSAELN